MSSHWLGKLSISAARRRSAAAATIAGLIITSSGILNIVGGGDLTLSNSLEIAQGGALQLNSSVDPTLAISGTVNLTGGGSIFLFGTGDNNIIAAGSGAKLVNIGSTIEGSGTIGHLGDGALTLVNSTNGIINATPLLPTDSGILIINTGNLVDNFYVMAADGGTLKIEDAVKNESAGLIGATDGGSVVFTGASVDNFGSIGSTTGPTGGGTVSFVNVTVTNEAGAEVSTDGSSTFVSFTGGTVANGGLILADGGAITFDNSPITNNSGSVLSLIADVANGVWASDGGTITFSGAQVTNSGLIEATVGAAGTAGTINFNSATVTNSGTIAANSGGTLTIENTTITNSTVDPNPPNTGVDGYVEALNGSHIDLSGATILKGFVTIDQSSEIDTVSGTANEIETANGSTWNTTVATIVNDGTINVADNSSLTLASPAASEQAAIDNSGTIELNSTGDATTLFFDQGFAGINGGGQITLSHSTENFISVTTSGDQLTNFDNTISGAGTIGGGGMVLVNDATIDADVSNTLTLDPITLTNTSTNTSNGVLEATAGGTLIISSPTVNNLGGAIIGSGTGSVVQLEGTTITDGTFTFTGGGTLEAKSGSSEISGVTNFTNDQLTIDSGATLTFDGDTISGGTITVDDGGTLDLVGTKIVGATLTLISGAILDVSGGTSTIDTLKSVLSGTTTVEAGQTLVLQDELVLGSIGDQGTVEVTGSTTISGGSIIESGSGLVQIDSGQTLKLESGAEISGGPIHNSGTIEVVDTASLSDVTLTDSGASGLVQVDIGATLTIDNATISGGSITDSGAISAAGISEIDAPITGDGTLAITSGTLTLSGGNSYSGATTINGGELALTDTGSIEQSNGVAVGDGTASASFDISGLTAGGTSITTLSGASDGTVNLGSKTLTLSDAASTFNGVIEGSGGGLTLTTGTETLTNTNSYSGATTINGGELALTDTGSIEQSNGVAVGDGTASASFDISGLTAGGTSITTLSGASDGTVNLGSKTLTLSDAASTFNGVIEGSGGGLTLTTGTETLTNTNSYSGATTINGGELALTDTGSIEQSNGVAVGDGTASASFDISGLTAGGTSITTLSGASDGTVNLGSKTLTLSDAASTFNGVIEGSGGGLTLTTGTETLTNTNSYSGATTINGGELALTDTGSIEQSNGVAVGDGTASASFDISGLTAGGTSITTLSGASDGTVNLGSKTLTLSDAASTFNGVIEGSGGGLTLTTGTETLTNTNSYSGATTINGGELALTDTGSIEQSNGVAVGDGTASASFDISGLTAGGTSITTLSGASDGTVNLGSKTLTLSDAASTFNGVIEGSGGGLTLTTGTETLTNTNSYSGATTINGGELALTDTGSIEQSNGVAVGDGTASASFDISGLTAGGTSITTLSGASDGTVNLGSKTLTLSDAASTFNGVIEGSGGGLTLTTGTETLTNTNSYSGATTINGGELALTDTGSIEQSNGVAVGDGTASASFDISGLTAGGTSITTLSGASDGTVNLGSKTLTLSDAASTFNGVIEGSGGGLTLTTGTETLTNTNSYSGATTINGGELALTDTGSIEQSNGVAVGDGTASASFDISGLTAGGTSITTLSGASDGTVNLGSKTLTLSDAASTFNGVIEGSGGGLTLTTGTETLTNTNSYSGATTINGGELALTDTGSIEQSNGVAVGDGTASASFDISGLTAGGTSITTLSGASDGTVNLGSKTLTLSDAASTFNGVIEGSGGGLTLTTGTETLTNTNSYSGATTINGGELALTDTGSIEQSNGVAVGDGTASASFDISGLTAGGTSITTLSGASDGTVNLGSKTLTLSDAASTFNGVIEGSGGGLTLTTGTETLTNTNSYSGATTINGGELALTDTGSIEQSNGVAVGDGTASASFDISGLTAGGTSITTLSGASDGTVNLGSKTLTLSDAASTFNGVIEGSGGGLTLTTGTETLTNTNSYSGATTINGGELALTDTGSIEQSNGVAVGDGTASASFDISGLTAGGTSITTLSGASDGTVNLGSKTLTLSDAASTFNGVIEGSGGGLTLTTGTETLTNTNSYSGATTINGGELALTDTGSIEQSNGVAVGDGTASASFDISGLTAGGTSITTLSGASDGTVNLGSKTLTLSDAASTFNGVIEGSGGGLTLTTGTETLTNTNSYSGATTINGGELALTDTGSIEQSNGVAVGDGTASASFDISGLTAGGTSITTLSGASDGTVNLGSKTLTLSDAASTFNGVIEGSGGGLTLTTGTETLTNTNSYSGATTINGGELALTDTGSIEQSNGVAVGDGTASASFDISGLTAGGTSITTLSGASDGTVNLGSKTLTLSDAASTFNGVIEGSGGGLTLTTGTETLTNTNSYSGATTINGGELALTDTGSIEQSNGVAVGDGTASASFDISGLTAGGTSITTLSGASDGTVNLGSKTLTLSDAASTFNGVIEGSGGGLTLTTGTETLTNTNSYSGATTINGGELALTDTGSIEQSNGVAVGDGTASASFDISGLTAGGTSITTLSGASDGTVNLGSKTLTLSDAASTFNGVIEGSGGGLTLTTGTETLTNTNSYSGATTINGGELALTDTGSIEQSNGVAVGDGTASASFDISGLTAGGTSITTLSGASDGTVNLGSKTLTLSDAASTFNGVIEGSGGGLTLTTGTETLTNTNSYSGATTINGGELALTDTGSIEQSNGVAVGDGTASASFDISGLTAGGTSITTLSGASDGTVNLGSKTLTLSDAASTFNGVIEGSGGGLTLTTGTETLTNTNSYSGATTINGGELALTDTGSIEQSNGVAVGDGTASASFDISGLTAGGTSITTLSGASDGTVNLGSKTLTLSDAASTFNGVIEAAAAGYAHHRHRDADQHQQLQRRHHYQRRRAGADRHRLN